MDFYRGFSDFDHHRRGRHPPPPFGPGRHGGPGGWFPPSFGPGRHGGPGGHGHHGGHGGPGGHGHHGGHGGPGGHGGWFPPPFGPHRRHRRHPWDDDDDYSSSDEDRFPPRPEDGEDSSESSSDSSSDSEGESKCHRRGHHGRRGPGRHGRRGHCPHRRRHHRRPCWPWPPHHHRRHHGRGPWGPSESENELPLHEGSDFGSDFHIINDLQKLNLDEKETCKRKDSRFKVAIPTDGFDRKNLKIRHNNGQLFLEGKQQTTCDYGTYMRTISHHIVLPDNVDPKTLKIVYRHGFIKIIAPKVKDQNKDQELVIDE